MRRRLQVWGVICCIGVTALVIMNRPEPLAKLPAPGELPKQHAATSVAVAPLRAHARAVATLTINAGTGASYGGRFDLDQRQRDGTWADIYQSGGGKVTEPNQFIINMSRADKTVFYSLGAAFGSSVGRFRVPAVPPGVYRIREAFYDFSEPAQRFELAATVTIV